MIIRIKYKNASNDVYYKLNNSNDTNGFWGDYLHLEPGEKTGFREFPKYIGKPKICLSFFAGWSECGLEEDFRKYALQLFDSQGKTLMIFRKKIIYGTFVTLWPRKTASVSKTEGEV